MVASETGAVRPGSRPNGSVMELPNRRYVALFTMQFQISREPPMRSSWLKHLMVAAVAGTMLAACTESTRTSETTGEYVDSSAITAKVKTALVKDQGLKGFDI